MTQIAIPKLAKKEVGSITTLEFFQSYISGQYYIFGLKRIDKGKYQYVTHIICSKSQRDIAYLIKEFPDIDCFFNSDLTPEENEELIKLIKSSTEYYFYDA